MNVGKYRTMVRIQEPYEGKDPEGGYAITLWRDFATLPMNIMESDAQKVTVARQVFTTMTGIATCRYYPGLVKGMRAMTEDGERMNFLEVINKGKEYREWEIHFETTDVSWE